MENGNAPDAVKKFVHPEVERRNKEIEAIELSEPEAKFALWIGKTNKWYKERHADCWAEKEAKKPGKATW